ncbi:hypothetical protein O9G_000320 [Rozella allomycis CSF55]|uniref:Uncharacterized protein n=1 Tax=Rozella allomycis (strain CSF55) TaxID=988480 RepID=A0A075AP77_ROZAC|nr:hypothetical protein O9G_000320 [Rozella allomycis CSF55]|eukprot:EPZ31841.1 hypothetical protein O9G_000320 [Rozella allomycis CSF55]
MIPVGLFYTEYDPTDFLSLIAAFVSYFPILAPTGFVFYSFTHLEYGNLKKFIRCIYWGIGIIVNEIINDVAKRLLNHERPNEQVRSHSSGMPSNHAQTTAFLMFMFLNLYVYHWDGQELTSDITHLDKCLLGQFLGLYLP